MMALNVWIGDLSSCYPAPKDRGTTAPRFLSERLTAALGEHMVAAIHIALLEVRYEV